jgi:hypothetical protein
MIKLDLKLSALPDLGGKLRQAVRRAMQAEAKPMRDAMRSHVASRLNIKKVSFLNTVTARVLDKRMDRLPALYVGSKVKWLGIHQSGGTISGKMLIPLYGRIGGKRFQAMVSELLRSGNAYFIKRNGKTILMAENIREHDKTMAGVKRRYRKGEGIARLKRGADIPIALLVSSVTIKKRLDVVEVVRGGMPMLVAAIGAEIGK